MNLDDLQARWDGMSWWEIRIFLFANIAVLAGGFASQMGVIFSAVPQFRCNLSSALNGTTANMSEEELLEKFVPYSDEKQTYERCYHYAITSQNSSENRTSDDWSTCNDGYVYSNQYYEETTVSEWDLVCERLYMDTLVNSIFCIGYFIGSLACGPLCDWFGRKRALLTFCTFYFVSAMGVALAPTYDTFIVARCLTATYIAAYITAFTFISETFPKKHRNFLVLMTSLAQTLVHVMVPLIAYLLRHWRHVALFAALMQLPFALCYPLMPESPRWLLSKGRTEEAKEVVRKMATSRRQHLDEDEWQEVVSSETKQANGGSGKLTVIDLFRTKRMRFITIIFMQIWFTISCLFYGMTLNIGNFFGNPYLNGTINAGIEILGNLIFLLAPYVGKIRLMSICYLLSGIACLSSTLVSLHASTSVVVVILAVIGKMNTQASMLLVYNITAEVYPTPARGTGLGLGSMSARLGCAMAPFVIQLQATLPWATQTIFGTLGIVSAVTSLFLPEIPSESPLLRSMEDAEEFYIKQLKLYNYICGYSKEELDMKNNNLDEAEELEVLKDHV